ncbi:MAG: iron-containing alcohol dehydrogenase [Reyranellaceae bacterium]
MTDLSRFTVNWNYPTLVRFGIGRIRDLADACKSLGMKRPLLVTDPGLAGLPMVASAIAANAKAGLPTGLFSDIQPNPVEKNVTDGVAAFRAGGHDGVIAFGGGSALDSGKAIAMMVGQTRSIFDFEDREDWHTRVDVAGMAPVVAVPTTSGTGSEVGRSSVVTDLRDHLKKIIFHARMMPAIVVADPELTVGLPPHITAAVGMDALSHNLEAYCASFYHPMADGIALQGMKLIWEWLPSAVADGKDLEARAHMMVASMMGATAFQKGLGAMHALSHPCSAVLNTHHGLTNGVVMPYVLAFNRPAIADRMAALARYLNLKDASFAGVLDAVLKLRQDIGIPHSLAELGVTPDHIARFAPMAAIDLTAASNPVPMGEQEMAALYRASVSGQLPG